MVERTSGSSYWPASQLICLPSRTRTVSATWLNDCSAESRTQPGRAKDARMAIPKRPFDREKRNIRASLMLARATAGRHRPMLIVPCTALSWSGPMLMLSGAPFSGCGMMLMLSCTAFSRRGLMMLLPRTALARRRLALMRGWTSFFGQVRRDDLDAKGLDRGNHNGWCGSRKETGGVIAGNHHCIFPCQKGADTH